MSVKDCTDCDYTGNRKCSACHGTGKVGFMDGMAAALAGESQDCEKCGGTGDCPTCEGKGFIDTGIFD